MPKRQQIKGSLPAINKFYPNNRPIPVISHMSSITLMNQQILFYALSFHDWLTSATFFKTTVALFKLFKEGNKQGHLPLMLGLSVSVTQSDAFYSIDLCLHNYWKKEKGIALDLCASLFSIPHSNPIASFKSVYRKDEKNADEHPVESDGGLWEGQQGRAWTNENMLDH